MFWVVLGSARACGEVVALVCTASALLECCLLHSLKQSTVHMQTCTESDASLLADVYAQVEWMASRCIVPHEPRSAWRRQL